MKNKTPLLSKLRAIKKNYLVPLALVVVFGASIATYAAGNTDLVLAIDEGVLSVDIVTSAGNSVVSPSITMGGLTVAWEIQTSTGTLGVNNERVRLSNPTNTPVWDVAIAATDGTGAAMWVGTTSGYTMDYNDSLGGTGTLTVDPSVGSIATVNGGGTATGVSLGTEAAFTEALGSITIYSADGTAESPEQFDLTDVELDQEVPALQESDSYEINMTLTAS